MISVGFNFENVVLNTDMTNLWKSDNSVNKVSVLKKIPGMFVNIKYIQHGLWTVLKQAVLKQVSILCSSCWNKKLSRHVSPILTLKSPTDTNFL